MGRAADVRRRIGRRGAALLAFAFVDFVLAWSLVDPQAKLLTAQVPTYRAHFEIAPIEFWGIAWALVGLSCVVHAFLSRDQVGFAAAIGIKLVWAVAFVGSWVIYDVPRGWLGAATWAVVAALVGVISGWPEPTRRPSPRPGLPPLPTFPEGNTS
jgi:hypothetical protein